MDKYLEENLLDGEKVLWRGRSESFRILSGAYAKTLPVIWAVSGIILAAFAVWFIPFALRIRPSVPQMLFTCVMAAVIPVSLCAHSVSDCRIIQKELEYALTSCRAIAVRGNSGMFMRIDENTPYRTEIQEDGTEILYIGSACDVRSSGSRAKAVMGVYGDPENPNRVTGMVFYGLKDAQKIWERNIAGAKEAA